MPLEIIENDITRVECDAIVNAANKTLLGGGGVDGAIHRAAGAGLLFECAKLGGCKVGEAKITSGYRLPSKYVIHTVGPVYNGGGKGEAELLAACYRNSLLLAREKGCESVAFPLISAGIYGYPPSEALNVAVKTVSEFLLENEMLVKIVIFDKSAISAYTGEADKLSEYIKKHLKTEIKYKNSAANCAEQLILAADIDKKDFSDFKQFAASIPRENFPFKVSDESFAQMLMHKIDERGITDPQCYRAANVSKQVFSKIRADNGYKPSKATACAFAIALKLSVSETNELLMKAGFALSDSVMFDVIIKYFIENGKYDIFQINEALFDYDQPLLGV